MDPTPTLTNLFAGVQGAGNRQPPIEARPEEEQMSKLTELGARLPGDLSNWSMAFVSLLMLLFAMWSYFFPNVEDFLEGLAPPDLRYVAVTSGVHADAYPIRFRTSMHTGDGELQNEEVAAIALVALVVTNQSDRPLRTPLTVSVESLSKPIVELVTESHNFNASMLDQCRGDDIFRPEELAGEHEFCFKIKTFPARGVISIFILVSADDVRRPLLRDDKVFIGTAEDPQAAKRVQLDRLFSERRRINAFTVGPLVALAIVIWFCRRPMSGRV